MDSAKYIETVSKYTSKVDTELVEAIVKRLAPILGSADSSLVSCSDDSELETVKKNFLSAKLGVEGEEADAAVAEVCEKMSDATRKCRVTFYYLLIEKFDAKDKYMG